jgi:hypothetical protein
MGIVTRFCATPTRSDKCLVCFLGNRVGVPDPERAMPHRCLVACTASRVYLRWSEGFHIVDHL